MILAIDPGSEKCGLALVEQTGKIISKKIIGRKEIKAYLADFLARQVVEQIVMGDSAFGRQLSQELSLPQEIKYVQEKNSTLEARLRYWQANPPKGLWRLVPTSLRFPPVPVDDWAAVILAERYLKG